MKSNKRIRRELRTSLLIIILMFLILELVISQKSEFGEIDLYEYGQIKWDSLKSKQPDLMMEFHFGGHSGLVKFKEGDEICICKDNNLIKYYIWKLEDEIILQKISCCKLYPAIKLKNDKLITKFSKYEFDLKNEKFNTSSVFVSDFMQLKYRIEEKDYIKYFDYSMIRKNIERENWIENKKTRSYKFMKWLNKYLIKYG